MLHTNNDAITPNWRIPHSFAEKVLGGAAYLLHDKQKWLFPSSPSHFAGKQCRRGKIVVVPTFVLPVFPSKAKIAEKGKKGKVVASAFPYFKFMGSSELCTEEHSLSSPKSNFSTRKKKKREREEKAVDLRSSELYKCVWRGLQKCFGWRDFQLLFYHPCNTKHVIQIPLSWCDFIVWNGKKVQSSARFYLSTYMSKKEFYPIFFHSILNNRRTMRTRKFDPVFPVPLSWKVRILNNGQGRGKAEVGLLASILFSFVFSPPFLEYLRKDVFSFRSNKRGEGKEGRKTIMQQQCCRLYLAPLVKGFWCLVREK